MNSLTVQIGYESMDEATAAAKELSAAGAQTRIEREVGLLPLPLILVVVIPEIVLLARVVERMILDWKGRGGVVIDARGTGAPTILKDAGLPYGTVVLLTRDGDRAVRTDLPEQSIGDYVAVALKQLAGGASASVAAAGAAKALAGAAGG